MKLTTRLVIVVTVILSISTFASGLYSAYLNQQNQLDNYDKLLNHTALQIRTTTDDPLSLALLLVEQSPIPMSLIYISNDQSEDQRISFLSEGAGNEFPLPKNSEIFNSKSVPINASGYLHLIYPLSESEALGFYLSTAQISENYQKSLRTTLLFNLLLVAISSILISIIFRRDSKLNSLALRMREFIGDASHELKSPLTVIRGYSELLMNHKTATTESSKSNELSQYAERINDESIRMAKIIDQMLALSALEEQNLGAAEDIDLSVMLDRKIADLKLLQPEREITFEPANIKIHAPYQLVDVLITNILDNARIHTPANAPIKVSLNNQKHNQKLIIEDGGPGLTKIPDKPFERFDTSRSRLTGGSGLGMSLIQKSAQAIKAKLIFGKSELGGLRIEINF